MVLKSRTRVLTVGSNLRRISSCGRCFIAQPPHRVGSCYSTKGDFSNVIQTGVSAVSSFIQSWNWIYMRNKSKWISKARPLNTIKNKIMTLLFPEHSGLGKPEEFLWEAESLCQKPSGKATLPLLSVFCTYLLDLTHGKFILLLIFSHYLSRKREGMTVISSSHFFILAKWLISMKELLCII